jgi:uncharacterized membrane protein
MPWCGYWGAPFGGFWWLMPLFGLVFMAFMFFVCFRGFGRWMTRPRRPDADLSELQREVASLRDELRKLRQPT